MTKIPLISKNYIPYVNQSVNSAKSLETAEINHLTGVLSRYSRAKENNIKKAFKLIKFPMHQHQKEICEKLIKTFEKLGVAPELIKPFKEVKTIGELQTAAYNYSDNFQKLEMSSIVKYLPKKQSGIPLEIEQMFYEKTNLYNRTMKHLNFVFAPKSQNPEVIKIEETLKNKYGVKTVRLADDLPCAQLILKGVETAYEKGIKIPESFIVSNFLKGGLSLNSFGKERSCVLIGSSFISNFIRKYAVPVKMSEYTRQLLNKWKEYAKFSNWSSTNKPEHIVVHEILHKEHVDLMAFQHKKIPKKFEPVILKLSGYSASRKENVFEVFNELNTKRLLLGLDSEEEKLFKFLGGEL